MFNLTNEDGKARTGILETKSGKIETPFFMPVATRGAVKFVTHKFLKEAGTEAIISNAFILYLDGKVELIKELGGIHKFSGWDGINFTDSGGFQMLSKAFLVGVNDKGVKFKSPTNGKIHFLTPEDVMQIEQDINSDVAMALDHVPVINKEYDYTADAVKRTHLWAERCKKAHTNDKQLLFGIAQGGVYKDLREKSAKFIDSLDFDGVAMGGLCIGETRDAMLSAIDNQVPIFNSNKPRYLMGVGNPIDLVESVYHGADLFDSRFPTQNARHATIFTSKGRILLKGLKYAKDLDPIDSECNCFACKNYSRAFLRYLLKNEEPLGYMMASLHNIYFVQNLMKEMGVAIKENRIAEFRNDFLKSYAK